MLRLGRGWSAEELSREYESQGTGSLNRATIAKIESETRQIKAGEVEGVARAFGLTAADLLSPGGPTVLLSYAEQDGTTGREVSAWLDDHGFRVLSRDKSELDRQRTGSSVWRAIDTVQAFVVLLSPSFLSSPECREELDLAVRRQQQLAASGLATDFIYVLQISDTSDLDTSGLRSRPWTDLIMVSGRKEEAALSQLGSRVIFGNRAPATPAEPANHTQGQQAFLDRRDELDRVLHGLSSPAGPHFWLVISPPGLGKSWFLRQLSAEAESKSPSWTTRILDLRLDVIDHQHDAMTVVRKLFDFDQQPLSEPADDLLGIAQEIIRTGRPCLCLLDSAELLPANETAALRKHLSQIYRLVQDAGNADARLAFVVASRREDSWRGLMPYPRLHILPLAEFGTATMQDALDRLALRMHRMYSVAELRNDAEDVRSATEGVPVLVQQGLRWIQAEEWLEIERLNSPQLFAKIVEPYIRGQLLTHDSLLPGKENQSEESEKQLAVLRDALRTLVPYRFFTLSHVHHHLEIDRSFREALKDANWRVEDLWQAIADMALLYRPLDEPWHEIHPAIRRLLYRYFYAPGERADAQCRARDFTMVWADKQTGQDHIIGMVESIWHEAARLRLSNAGEMGDVLPDFVRKRSLAIHRSAYDETELRAYAAQRMRNDDELQREVANVDGLFEKLVRIAVAPGSAGGAT